MAIDQKMAFLEEEMSKEPDKSGFKPFFFSIADGQKALIRPLLNMNQYTLVNKHEFWNPGLKVWEARAICAADLELECQICKDAENNKKLTASKRFILPVYVHAVVDVKTGQPVTYKNQDNEDLPVCGPRLLEMKRTSSILRDLVASFNEDDGHDITTMDFVIRREGAGTDTTYTVTPKAPKPFPSDIDIPVDYRNPEQIKWLFADACPAKPIDDLKPEPVAATPPAKSASNGKVKSAPDF